MVEPKTIKENLTNEQIISILYSLGSDGYKTSSEEALIFQSVCHHRDGTGKYKLYYYLESKTFHCYSSCSDSFDIFELVKRNKECNFGQAVSFVCEAIGLNVKQSFQSRVKILDDWEILNKYTRDANETSHLEIETYNEAILDIFKDVYYSGWINEGMTISALESHKIRYDVYRNAIIIPHYNIDGELIGIRRRALNEFEVSAGYKYMPLKLEGKEYSHPLMFNLYGLNINKEGIKKSKKVIIVESEKAVILARSFYGDDCWAVACCGSNISNYQRDLILSQNPLEVMIGFDKEFEDPESEEAKKYEQKIYKIGQKFSKYVTTWAIWDDLGLLEKKDSPFDRGKDILELLLKNKKEITCEE